MNKGIYKWTNKINNKSYIGKSTNIVRRKSEHLYTLRNNKHRNTIRKILTENNKLIPR